jgi:hypothetical protein
MFLPVSGTGESMLENWYHFIEPPGHEFSEYVFRIFFHACEQNDNEKCPGTSKKLMG